MSDLAKRANELLVGTTDGPWRVKGVQGNREYSPHYGVASHEWNHPNVVKATSDWEGFGSGSTLADATFIAEARELVPAMAAEIERLQAELPEPSEYLPDGSVQWNTYPFVRVKDGEIILGAQGEGFYELSVSEARETAGNLLAAAARVEAAQ